MSNKSRKRIWSMSLVMSIAIIGALAAFVVLANNPGSTAAHGGAVQNHCDDLASHGGPFQQSGIDQHDEDWEMNPDGPHTCADGAGNPDDTTDTGNGNGNGMMDDRMHAAMPQGFWLEGLDNGARLDWDAPNMTSPGASVIGYRIDRKAWNSNPDHPINAYGGATIDIFGVATDYSDLGLAYNSVYTYQVRAIVEYDAEHWWNALSPAMKSSVVTNGGEMMYAALSDDAKALVYAAYDLQEGKYPYMSVDEWWDSLDCVKMNDAVSPMGSEPAVGSDDPTNVPRSAYCYMYNDLKVDAKSVVHRAWMNSYNRYAMGVWTYKRTLETAESGGRLAALLDPPSMVRMLSATPACADRVSVMWQAPNDMGTVPATDQNGVYVGPDYIGADDAGREEVGTDATMVTYQVQRMVNNGPWAAVTPVGMTYTDTNVAYGSSYKYRVRAMNGAGLYGPWAMETEDLTEPAEPQMPRSLNVDPVNGTVELQWDPPDRQRERPTVAEDGRLRPGRR